MRSGGGASKRQLALLTYVGKDIPDMCSLFFRFYTGYHQLARRDIFVVQMGSSLDACLLRYRPTILRSDSSERPFLERTTWRFLSDFENNSKALQCRTRTGSARGGVKENIVNQNVLKYVAE